MRLYVATSEFLSADRLGKIDYIHQSFKAISKIKAQETKCVLTINPVDSSLFNHLLQRFSDIPCPIEIRFPKKIPDNFYFLCWEHKNYLKEFLDQDYDYFLYLENDQLVTQTNIDYWVNSRKLFLEYNTNFIPGFHRIEYSFNNIPFSVDCLRPIDKKISPVVTFGDKKFINSDQPYQGMYMMDKILVEEHLTSSFYQYNPDKNHWGVPEQANIGNMYDNIPPGFAHRNLLPLDEFSQCWVHHSPNKFVNEPHERFGKIPMNSLIIG